MLGKLYKIAIVQPVYLTCSAGTFRALEEGIREPPAGAERSVVNPIGRPSAGMDDAIAGLPHYLLADKTKAFLS
jgi:hypothetical protein